MIPVFRDFFLPSEYNLLFSHIPPELPAFRQKYNSHTFRKKELYYLYTDIQSNKQFASAGLETKSSL